MPAYIQETGRSYPNPVKGGGFNQTFRRPSSGKYRTSSDYPGQLTGMDYNITFEDGGPGFPLIAINKESFFIALVSDEMLLIGWGFLIGMPRNMLKSAVLAINFIYHLIITKM